MLVNLTNDKLHQSREVLPNSKAKELWLEMQQGSKAAFELLFKCYYADLYDFGMKKIHSKEMVSDALQDLFIYIWQKKENLSEVKTVRSYLLTSLRNKLVNVIQNRKIKLNKTDQWQKEQVSFALSSEDNQIDFEHEQERKKLLHEAIQSVSEREREALYLKTYQDCSYRDISQIMEISEQVARNYVCGALKKLRSYVNMQSSHSNKQNINKEKIGI